MYYDGKLARNKTLIGESQSNTGDLYIGKDPWYQGVVGAGFDNIQVHNKALTNDEILQTAAGQILFNENLVLALDFTDGVKDRQVKDLSSYGHNADYKGHPKMLLGGPSSKKKAP